MPCQAILALPRHHPDSAPLGKLGLLINIIAVVWSVGMAINLAWSPKDVYNATEPFHWYLQRHKTGVLASQAMESPSPAVADSTQPAPAAGGSE
jgi:hypothetical protein